ncbi:MAG: alanine racemase [Candidatus Pacebacteria bacterium]|jgi:alanine racemase|nr:alanine racemase [Candidatus Paceibacterota bacterium]
MSVPLSYIHISRANLEHNIGVFRKRLPADTMLVAVVKANAYGHGLKEIVSIAEPLVDAFQVDDIEELRAIRVFTAKPVYIFGYVPRGALSELVALNGILGVYDLETVSLLSTFAQKSGKVIPVHVKIDALLGRQGILIEELPMFIEKIKTYSHVALEAVYSHFSNIEDTDDLDHARKQYKVLIEAKQYAAMHGFPEVRHHISATSGFLVEQEGNWGGVFVRLGIGMYGLWPSSQLRKRFSSSITLLPVLSWMTKLAQVKEVPAGYPIGYGLSYVTAQPMKIGIVPQGYSDGYDRGFSSNGFVLVGGTSCPIVGRIAMNMFAVDVSGLAGVVEEDTVILIGEQGHEVVSADALAERIGTINYEIMARISPLLPRRIS